MLPYTFDAPYFRHPPNQHDFLREIGKHWAPHSWRYKKIKEAYELSRCVCGDRRRDNGELVFDHMTAVAFFLVAYLHVSDYREVIVAVLHDVIEKYGLTFAYIDGEFGTYVAKLIFSLSKPRAVSKFRRDLRHHRGFHQHGRAYFRTKLTDRLRNILTADVHSSHRALEKALQTRKHHLVQAKKHGILVAEIEEAIALLEAFHQRKLRAA